MPFPFCFQSVGVSSLLGLGIEEFFTAVEDARKEYMRLASHVSLGNTI